MQKFIRTMAIVAVALAALSVLLLLISVPLQQLIADEIYGWGGDLLGLLPIFPVLPLLFTLLRTACMVPLIFCSGNKKVGIWLEIVVFAVLLLVLPFLSQIADTLATQILSQIRGSAYLTAHSVVNQISNMCLRTAGWGQALAYAVCGMSLVYKKHSNDKTVLPIQDGF